MTYLGLILGMMLVTYLPRLIPFVLLSTKELSPRMKKFLLYIPYTSLTILIVRGIVTADQGMVLPSFVGIGLAALLAYLKGNLILSVFVGIVGAFLTIQFI